MRSALDIANYFIKYSGYAKTNLQILKMSYIAHGYMLALYDKPLFDNVVEAWDYGPVVPDIYKKFKKWGANPIPKVSGSISDPFDSEEQDILDTVYPDYGRYCGFYLSQITHEPGTPWSKCHKPSGNARIDDQTTKEYYKKLLAV